MTPEQERILIGIDIMNRINAQQDEEDSSLRGREEEEKSRDQADEEDVHPEGCMCKPCRKYRKRISRRMRMMQEYEDEENGQDINLNDAVKAVYSGAKFISSIFG